MLRLLELGIPAGKGLLTDMRALRLDEDYSPIHSIYVDKWDWEKHILPEQRTIASLQATVETIYEVLKTTEQQVSEQFGIALVLPSAITFIHAEDLLLRYPILTPKQREHEAAREYSTVFLTGISGELSHGEIYDGRAPDSDDWSIPQRSRLSWSQRQYLALKFGTGNLVRSVLNGYSGG